MIDMNDLTLKQIKEIQDLFSNKIDNVHPWVTGKAYFIRTITMYLIGKLSFVTPKELVLKDASWIPDSGRFHDALKNGKLNQVEPFIDEVIINRDCIVDATYWNHQLPHEQI